MRKPEPKVRSLRQNWRKLARIAVFPLFVSTAVLLAATSEWRHEQRLALAMSPIQVQLEAYHQEYQQYPASLSQIGIADEEDDCIHYQREAGDDYSLWFGAHVSPSKTLH